MWIEDPESNVKINIIILLALLSSYIIVRFDSYKIIINYIVKKFYRKYWIINV